MIVDAVGPERRAAAIGLYRVVGDSAFTGAPFVSGYMIDHYGFFASGLIPAGVVGLALLAGMTVTQRRRAPSRLPAPVPIRSDEAPT
jgi:MFS family permease